MTVAKSAFEWQMFSRCSFSPTVPCNGIDSAKRKKGRDMGQGLTKHEASTPCTQRRTRKRAHRNVSSQNNPETSANQWWGMQRSWHSLWVYTLQHATRRRARAETAMMQNRAKQHMIPRWVEHHSCTSSRGDECVAVSAETTTHRCGCLQRLATERLMHRLRCSLPS